MAVSRCIGLVVLALLSATGCAKGFTATAAQLPPSAPSDSAASGSVAPVAYTGDECATVGERVPCICADGTGQGIKACGSDTNSPTKGTYSECTACAAVPEAGRPQTAATMPTMSTMPTMPTMPTTRAGTAGRASRGGSGGTGSSADKGSTSAPSSSGTGGRTGSTATVAGRTGSATSSGACNCNQVCFPIGIVACCRLDMSCGCSWAPGAYCL